MRPRAAGTSLTLARDAARRHDSHELTPPPRPLAPTLRPRSCAGDGQLARVAGVAAAAVGRLRGLPRRPLYLAGCVVALGPACSLRLDPIARLPVQAPCVASESRSALQCRPCSQQTRSTLTPSPFRRRHAFTDLPRRRPQPGQREQDPEVRRQRRRDHRARRRRRRRGDLHLRGQGAPRSCCCLTVQPARSGGCGSLTLTWVARTRSRVPRFAQPPPTPTRARLQDGDRISEFELKLMDIDSEHLGIPETGEQTRRVVSRSSSFPAVVRPSA